MRRIVFWKVPAFYVSYIHCHMSQTTNMPEPKEKELLIDQGKIFQKIQKVLLRLQFF